MKFYNPIAWMKIEALNAWRVHSNEISFQSSTFPCFACTQLVHSNVYLKTVGLKIISLWLLILINITNGMDSEMESTFSCDVFPLAKDEVYFLFFFWKMKINKNTINYCHDNLELIRTRQLIGSRSSESGFLHNATIASSWRMLIMSSSFSEADTQAC